MDRCKRSAKCGDDPMDTVRAMSRGLLSARQAAERKDATAALDFIVGVEDLLVDLAHLLNDNKGVSSS